MKRYVTKMREITEYTFNGQVKGTGECFDLDFRLEDG